MGFLINFILSSRWLSRATQRALLSRLNGLFYFIFWGFMEFFQVNFSAWDNGATFVVLCGWLPLRQSGLWAAVPVNSSETRPTTFNCFFSYPFRFRHELSMTIVKLNRHRLWGCFSFWAPTERPERPTRRTDQPTDRPQICQRAAFFVFSCCPCRCCLLLLLVKYVLRILRCRRLFVRPSFRLSVAPYFAF